jgi:SsrA-binding protein
MAAEPPRQHRIQPVAEHRRARFDFHVEERLEAGLQLLGSEVKSLRQGTVNLGDAYALPTRAGELILHNAHIGPYEAAKEFGHEPTRPRKLLMHREEIDRWSSRVRERGYSIIPLKLYFKDGRAKVELGLCKGKTHEDRRQTIKERETRREMDRAVRRR